MWRVFILYSIFRRQDESTTLAEAEVAMLDMYVTRAGGFMSCHAMPCLVMSCPDIPSSPDMADGLSLLDLGCGWGSVALYMAAKFPNSQGAGVS